MLYFYKLKESSASCHYLHRKCRKCAFSYQFCTNCKGIFRICYAACRYFRINMWCRTTCTIFHLYWRNVWFYLNVVVKQKRSKSGSDDGSKCTFFDALFEDLQQAKIPKRHEITWINIYKMKPSILVLWRRT